MTSKRIYTVLMALIAVVAVSAQTLFNSLTMENGLSGKSVFSIYKDVHGFYWFGTSNGATMYNGASTRKFMTGDNSSGVIVYSIAEDAKRPARHPIDRAGHRIVPAARGGLPPERQDAPRQRHQQRDGMAGNLVETVVGHIGHIDPVLSRRRGIHRVIADAIAGDDPELRTVFDDPARTGGILDDDPVGIPAGLDDLILIVALAGDELMPRALDDAALLVEIFIQIIGDNNPSHRCGPLSVCSPGQPGDPASPPPWASAPIIPSLFS